MNYQLMAVCLILVEQKVGEINFLTKKEVFFVRWIPRYGIDVSFHVHGNVDCNSCFIEGLVEKLSIRYLEELAG